MTDWQQRVVQEKSDLDQKIGRLTAFVAASTFDALPEAEKGRLRDQLVLMEQYSAILGERIKAFQ